MADSMSVMWMADMAQTEHTAQPRQTLIRCGDDSRAALMTHRPHRVSSLAALLLLAFASACSTPDKPAPAVARKTVESPGKKAVAVSDEQAGGLVTLEREQELVVSLPLAGPDRREWRLVDLRPGVLAAPSSKFERAPRNVNSGEAAGATVWRFKPEAAGSVSLRFELRRPRSLEPAVQTVTYDVTVK
jgi:hypothetical protein